MSLTEMQRSIDDWIADNGGYWEELALLARLTEEVGELAREYNHRFGPKKKEKNTESQVALEDEMADVLWILLCMANQQGLTCKMRFRGRCKRSSDAIPVVSLGPSSQDKGSIAQRMSA